MPPHIGIAIEMTIGELWGLVCEHGCIEKDYKIAGIAYEQEKDVMNGLDEFHCRQVGNNP